MDFVNSAPKAGKLEKILEQLRVLATKRSKASANVTGGELAQAAAGKPRETLTDDGPLSADQRAWMVRDEGMVREVLGMVGVDYDALIKMDGNTPYSRAVKANPQLVADVAGSDMPVVQALKIAMGFKPYAEFMDAYGTDPKEIREKIKAEVLAEGRKADPLAEANRAKVRNRKGVPLFSGDVGSRPPVERAREGRGLADIFGR